MNILTLDLGTTTGWAIVQSGHVVKSGSESFRPRRFDGGGLRYLRFLQFLEDRRTHTASIRAIFYEEVRRHMGVDAAHAYGGFLAVLTAWCENSQIAYEGIPVGRIKKHIAGKGNASKQQVIRAVTALGHKPADDNEADAISIAYWVITNRLGEKHVDVDSRTSCSTI